MNYFEIRPHSGLRILLGAIVVNWPLPEFGFCGAPHSSLIVSGGNLIVEHHKSPSQAKAS